MIKRYGIAGLVAALCLLSACGGQPRPLTIEEQDAYMIRRTCIREANNVNPGFQGPWNPLWLDYYAMCMKSMGVSDAVLNRMWP